MDNPRLNRRDFLRAGSAVGFTLSSTRSFYPQAGQPLGEAAIGEPELQARLGKPIFYRNSYGDVWTTTWADDDNLYTVSDDTTGFSKACDSNLALSRLVGSDPAKLQGVTINCMRDFGKGSEKSQLDDATWKASGFMCLDGVLYLAVSRHHYADDFGYSSWIQETWDASIIKSEDHGKTWQGIPKVGQAMFPGRIFSNPFFVQYGKNGQAIKDGADRYVYALSNDGAWNNGNWMTFGRVPRDRMARLDPRDWEFIQHFEKGRIPVWGPRGETAGYVFRAPGRCSMTSITYVAGLALYLMPQWHYEHMDDPKRRGLVSVLEFHSAPAPWGPWTVFSIYRSEPAGWYNPCIWNKFASEDGRRLWMSLAGGAGATNGEYYCLTMVPVELEILR